MTRVLQLRDGAALEAVRKAARATEPDRYVAALLGPAAIRDDLVALAAFAGEIARIPAQVREPMMGEIRLQWWHDAIDAAFRGQMSGHPVADGLAMAIAAHELDPARLHAIVEARLFELGGKLHADDAALLAHLEQTEGGVFALSLQVSGVAPAAEAATTANAAGRAYGLARALGRLPALLHNGGFPIPASRLTSAGIDAADLMQRPVPRHVEDGLAAAIAALQRLSRDATAAARSSAIGLGRPAPAALLPLAMVEPYFSAPPPKSPTR